METFKAWAIDTRSDEGHGFVGRYWKFVSDPLPVHMKGCRTALFETRVEARENLPKVKRAFPKAQVKRVTVTIE